MLGVTYILINKFLTKYRVEYSFKAQENYSNGAMDGNWIWWRPDGIKDREGYYKTGVKHGVWTLWKNEDHKKNEETFVDGRLDGMITIWYDNGSKDREGIIRINEPEGLWNYYHSDGSKDFSFDYGTGLERVRISEVEEREGLFFKIGKYKPYSGMVIETGGVKDYLLLGRFESGKRNGQWVQWYRNGQKEVEGEYFRGEKNSGLTKLIDEYKALSLDNKVAEQKLEKLLGRNR